MTVWRLLPRAGPESHPEGIPSHCLADVNYKHLVSNCYTVVVAVPQPQRVHRHDRIHWSTPTLRAILPSQSPKPLPPLASLYMQTLAKLDSQLPGLLLPCLQSHSSTVCLGTGTTAYRGGPQHAEWADDDPAGAQVGAKLMLSS